MAVITGFDARGAPSWYIAKSLTLGATASLPKQLMWIEGKNQQEVNRLLLGREALLFKASYGFKRRTVSVASRATPGDGFAPRFAGKHQKQDFIVSSHPQAWADCGRGLQATRTPSETLMQYWAGNAMALPVVLAILRCAFIAPLGEMPGLRCPQLKFLRVGFDMTCLML